MSNIVDFEFAWDFFQNTGNIEGYLLYNVYKSLHTGMVTDENYSDDGIGAQNCQYE